MSNQIGEWPIRDQRMQVGGREIIAGGIMGPTTERKLLRFQCTLLAEFGGSQTMCILDFLPAVCSVIED